MGKIGKVRQSKIKVRKMFKGKHVCDDDSSGRLIRIVTDAVLPDSEIDKHILKANKGKIHGNR